MKKTQWFVLVGSILFSLGAYAQNDHPDEWDISKLDLTKLPPVADNKDVTYADVKPLFDASCTRCHGADEKPKGGLRLDSRDAAVKGGKHSKDIVVGDSKNSLLVAAAAQIDNGIAMPPKRGPRRGPGGGPQNSTNAPAMGGMEHGEHSTNAPAMAGMGDHSTNAPAGGPGMRRGGPPAKPLTPEEVGLIRAWIDQGAK